MSDWSTTIDAIVTDLRANVTAVSAANAELHRYDTFDPEELEADTRRHLAVWPNAEGSPENAGDYTNSSRLIDQVYVVLVWEGTGYEATRKVKDEAGSAAFLQLQNDIRARFLLPAQSFGGAWLSRYDGAEFGNRSNVVRWFRMLITCRRNVPLA